MVESPRPDVWLHASLEVRHSSIAGDGLFAVSAIDEGTAVLRLGGRLVNDRELRAIFEAAEDYVDTITIDEGVHLALPRGSPVHFGNHSCDPNLWHVGPYELAARRPIQAGEEVTLDYATHTGVAGFSMPCHCGSSLCRGEVTGQDWQRPELQARYEGHWVPTLRRRIDAHRRGQNDPHGDGPVSRPAADGGGPHRRRGRGSGRGCAGAEL